VANTPKPHGAFQLGAPASEEEVGVAAHLLKKVQAIREAGDLPSHKMVRDLPGGGQVIAQDMGGIVKTIIMKPEQQQLEPIEPPIEELEFDRLSIPMLYSGRILTASVKGDAGVRVHLTRDTLRRLKGYDPNKESGPEIQELQRFRVPCSAVLSELVIESETRFFTQYASVFPTWWSGAMSEVVQIISGFGRQDMEALPEAERITMAIPENIKRRMEAEKDYMNSRLPGYLGKPDPSGEIQYDYKFYGTEVVSFDTKKRPWLVRIDRSGVHAMPLPLIPATTTKTFRSWMGAEEDWSVDDPEITAILERFGGIPSGERMPYIDEDFQAWKRAGVIIKVCDTGDFYHHAMHTSACGWSVNSKGSEGFNTCWDYDDEGFVVGFAYKLTLRLGAINEKPQDNTGPISESDSAKLATYLADLLQQLREASQKNLAIKYKLGRVGIGMILERARSADGKNDLDYWHNLEIEPIAQHSGGVAQVGKGSLYTDARKHAVPQLKLPEPILWGCVTCNLFPREEARGKPPPRCNTIVFGYYAGDNLKVVKYFFDPRRANSRQTGGFDPCTGEGSMTTSGEGYIFPNYYSTDFDDRGKCADSTRTDTTTLSPAGMDNPPRWEFYYDPCRVATLYRNFYFNSKTEIDSVQGEFKNSGLCVPFFSRNSLLYAHRKSSSGRMSLSITGVTSFRDSVDYTIYTNHRLWHWRGVPPVMAGRPIPVDGNIVWAEVENRRTGPCSDVVGGQSWVMPPQDVKGMMAGWTPGNYGGGGSPPTGSTGGNNGTEFSFEKKEEMHFSMEDIVDKLEQEAVHEWYFEMSPDESGGVFYRDATENAFGDAEYRTVSEPFGSYTKWGRSKYADDKSIPRFIGVINE